jgi:hypothetical protein
MFSKCETDKAETGTGKFNLTVQEPNEADENITSIFISIKKIELKGPDGWKTYKTFDVPLTLDLLDSKTNKSYFLGEKLLPAGHYMEARLILDKFDNRHNDVSITSGCYLLYNDNEIKPVYIPNDSKNGIVAKGEFNLPAEGVVNISLNFDIREIKQTGEAGHYLLKPKIKMVVNNDTGLLEGEFENNNDYKKIVAFAYSANTFPKNEFMSSAFQEKRLSSSSSSSILNDEGKFVLSFLKSGKYDLYFYSYDEEGNFESLIGKLEDIEIEGGQKTIVKVPKEMMID